MNKILFSLISLLYKLYQHPLIIILLGLIDGVRCARLIGVKIGDCCRVLNCNFGSEPYLIQIGNHVSIGSGVSFITHDGGVWVLRVKDNLENIDMVAPITVGNNVFIGNKTVILPGVNIGDNVVIGAGSIVTKDIPSNSVAAGCPAKAIRTIESYEKKIKEVGMHIKHLSHKQKREYLSKHLSNAVLAGKTIS
jgi:acetyltransferase-like isoleucine patch superfamily enzyme